MNQRRIAALRQELADIRHILSLRRWKRELETIRLLRDRARMDRLMLKYGYDPNQPRVPAGNSDGGQWTDGGGGVASTFFESWNRENASSQSPVLLAGGFEPSDSSKTVQNFISEKCLASVGRRIDKPMLHLTIQEMLELAASGNPMAVRCKKILGQDRFRK